MHDSKFLEAVQRELFRHFPHHLDVHETAFVIRQAPGQFLSVGGFYFILQGMTKLPTHKNCLVVEKLSDPTITRVEETVNEKKLIITVRTVENRDQSFTLQVTVEPKKPSLLISV